MDAEKTNRTPTRASIVRQEEITTLLEGCEADQVSPVARAFVLGLAHLIGAEGAYAFLRDLDASCMTLNEVVAAIHENWVRQQHNHRPLTPQARRQTGPHNAATAPTSRAGMSRCREVG